MAGHGYTKLDPAVQRWNLMREDVYKHFRFTTRTTTLAVWGFLIVPAAIYYTSTNQDLKWKWAGKTKEESLATK